MYNESTTIVDVVATTDGYALSIKAGDLYIAYEVVRRHVDDDGARHFAQLTKSEITEDGYAFTFDTGDAFTCSTADEYPASETLSDESSGGGSGGVLVVTDTDGTLDKTWQEIRDGGFCVARGEAIDGELLYGTLSHVYTFKPLLPGATTVFYVEFVFSINGERTIRQYAADSANGYPASDDDGGGGVIIGE